MSYSSIIASTPDGVNSFNDANSGYSWRGIISELVFRIIGNLFCDRFVIMTVLYSRPLTAWRVMSLTPFSSSWGAGISIPNVLIVSRWWMKLLRS